MSIVDADLLLSVVGFSAADLIPADLASFAHLMVGQDDYCDPCYDLDCDGYCEYEDGGGGNLAFIMVLGLLHTFFAPILVPIELFYLGAFSLLGLGFVAIFGVLFAVLAVSFAAIPVVMVVGGILIFGTMFLILVAAIVALVLASPFLLAIAVVWFITIGIPYLIYLALDALFPGMFTWVGTD